MKLYTPEEISDLVERFGAFKVNQADSKEVFDHIAVIQTIASSIEEFLREHEKPKRSVFLGLFGSEEDER